MCASATVTVVTSRAIAPHPRHPTAPTGGISASATPPNTIPSGIISKGWTRPKKEERARAERQQSEGYAEASHYGWAGSGDGSRSADEMRALELLELEADADFTAIKKAYRAKAKEVHPDVKPGDAEAAAEFQKLQVAYEVLRMAEERREWKG